MNCKPSTALRAVTIGGAMIDTIAVVDDELIERISLTNTGRAYLLLEQGTKTEASSISTHCGGGAINAAVAQSRLGFTVYPIVKVGTDSRAQIVRETAREHGLETAGITSTSSAPTGASAIISAHDRNAAIFTFRGANTMLVTEELHPTLFDADLVYVAPLSGNSADALPGIVARAKSTPRLLVVNPGLRQIATRFAALHQLLPEIDILALNRLEAVALARKAVTELAGTDNARVRRIAASGLDGIETARSSSPDGAASALIEAMQSLGARRVLLTDGKRGAYLGRENGIVHAQARDVIVMSTVGAGDAFVSTYAGMYALTGDDEHSLHAAIENSASVVQKIDTHGGLLTRKELEDKVDSAGRAAAIRSLAPKL